MKNSPSQRRILRRRSPPRIMSMYAGIGVEHALEKQAVVKQSLDKPKEDHRTSLLPRLVNTLSTGELIESQNVEKRTTSVNTVEDAENMTKIQVSSHHHDSLVFEGDIPIKEKKQSEKIKPTNSILGSSIENRSYRSNLTNRIRNEGAEVIPGIRQIWALDEEYSSEKFHYVPVLSIQGDQATRITFHRGAGGIIQDLEIPPQHETIEIEVPEGTKSFTIEGLGGKNLDYQNVNMGSSSITSVFASQTLPSVGFQRLSTVHQIGLYRYLGRGCYIQSQESASKRTMEETTTFHAGEVLAKIDNLRFYCGSSIQTLVTIVRMLPGETPNLKIAMEGISSVKEPLAIKRTDAVAYIWQVQSTEGFQGPAIIDIITDETTDVNSVMGFNTHPQLVLDLLQEQKWVNLVHEGPLSYEGTSRMSWTHEANVKESSDGLKFNLKMSKVSNLSSTTLEPKEFVQPVVIPQQPKPEIKPLEPEKEIKVHTPQFEISPELPRLPRTEATTGEPFQFDLSVFVGDDDEGDVHKFTFLTAPNWLLITELGQIVGTPSVEDVGIHECVIRVTDAGGLSSDAVLEIEVKEKILNRAPYWKPNVKIGGEASSSSKGQNMKQEQSIQEKPKVDFVNKPEFDTNISINQNHMNQKDSSRMEFNQERGGNKAKRKRR